MGCEGAPSGAPHPTHHGTPPLNSPLRHRAHARPTGGAPRDRGSVPGSTGEPCGRWCVRAAVDRPWQHSHRPCVGGVVSTEAEETFPETLESGQHVRLAWHHSQWLPSAAMGAPSHPPPQHATSFGPLYSALDSAPVSPPLANQRPLTLQCLAHLCMIELSTHTTSCPPTPINAVGHGRSVLKLRSTSGAWNRPRRRTLQHCTEPRVARTTQTDHRMRKGS